MSHQITEINTSGCINIRKTTRLRKATISIKTPAVMFYSLHMLWCLYWSWCALNYYYYFLKLFIPIQQSSILLICQGLREVGANPSWQCPSREVHPRQSITRTLSQALVTQILHNIAIKKIPGLVVSTESNQATPACQHFTTRGVTCDTDI